MGMSWRQITDLIYDNARKTEIPVRASFELTARCNFHCKMCYVCRYPNDSEAIEQELTAEQWIQLAQEAQAMGVLFITLTGGEIFIRKDFKEIYEAFYKMGFHITLNTNGSLINRDIAEWLSLFPPTKVSVSLYGGTPETYQKITGNAAGYEMTIKGVENLIAKGIHVELKTTAIKENQNDFDQIAEIAERLGITFGIVSNIEQKRDDVCTDPTSNRMSPMEVAVYEKKFADYMRNQFIQKNNLTEHSEDMKRASAPQVFETDELLNSKNEINIEDIVEDNGSNEGAFRCSAGKYACWFTWEGNLVACGLLNTPSLNAIGKPLVESWNQLKGLCKEIPTCKECKKCEISHYCNSCPARLYLETGSFDNKSEYLCKIARCRREINQ